MGALGSILAAASYALRIWAVNAYYLLTERIDSDITSAETERDRLRAAGGPVNHLVADRLQNRILRRSGIFVPEPPAPDRPAAGAPPPGGAPRADG